MLVVSTLLDISEHLPAYLACLLLAGLMAVGVNYVALRRATGGLLFLQLSFAFNTAIVLFGWTSGALSLFRVAHYFFYQWTTVIGIYWVYCSLLRNRASVFERLGQCNVAAVSGLLVSFNLVMFGLFYCLVVQNEGASRIEFMTAGWFSFLRPVISILTPLGFFLPFYLLDRGYRLFPLLILASSVASNIASGSKASFVFGIAGALLFYEDLKGSRLVMPRSLKIILLASTSLSAMFTLVRLDATLSSLAERFVRFGESTIMVYYADDPSAAAAGVSTLAKVHRGAARLLGDRSAADVDTLFGFALSRGDNGAHNFTGPNAQVSSYMLCNYAGWENLIGIASIIGYLGAVASFVHFFIRRQASGSLLLIPFLVASLNDFLQDYYQGMSDVTLILMVELMLVAAAITTLACQGVRCAERA